MQDFYITDLVIDVILFDNYEMIQDGRGFKRSVAITVAHREFGKLLVAIKRLPGSLQEPENATVNKIWTIW